ncbi:MAG: Uma2 family endonuclease [Gammaproteobacteria bacterium]
MSTPDPRAARYEDLFDLPETLVGEIIAGQVHTHPRPAPRHARAYSAMGFVLGGSFDGGDSGPGGWWILDEPELHLGPHVLVPDLAGWRRERMPELPETAWFEQAPDWVCEILSPSTARIDRALKMPLYSEYGVAHCWLVDPDARTLEVFARQDDGHWLQLAVLKDNDAVSQPPFDAISFPLDRLWA